MNMITSLSFPLIGQTDLDAFRGIVAGVVVSLPVWLALVLLFLI